MKRITINWTESIIEKFSGENSVDNAANLWFPMPNSFENLIWI